MVTPTAQFKIVIHRHSENSSASAVSKTYVGHVSKNTFIQNWNCKILRSSREFGYIIPDDGGADVCFKSGALIMGSPECSSSVRGEFLEDRKVV